MTSGPGRLARRVEDAVGVACRRDERPLQHELAQDPREVAHVVHTKMVLAGQWDAQPVLICVIYCLCLLCIYYDVLVIYC